jgi:choline dehydrogenase-like flavoprotein
LFRDARALEDGAILPADVCIVGTGAAGVACASELIKSGYRVLVLESGGREPDKETTSLGDLECTGLPVGADSRQRFFGGTTNSWWGKVALLDESDFEARDWVPTSGWPIRRSDLDPYYRDACALMGMPDLTRFSFPDDSLAGLLRSEALETKPFFWTAHPLNFGSLYLRLATGAASVSTLLNANAIEILLDDHGNVHRIAVATSNGKRFSVEPQIAIMACGGIENARLLLNSTSKYPSGVGNALDQVGRYYMDHPRGPSGKVAARPGASSMSPAFWSGKRYESVRYRLGVSLSPAAQAKRQALSSYVNLSPVYGGEGVSAVRKLYRKGPGALRDRATAKALLTGVPDIGRYLMFKRYGRGRVHELTVENYMEQEPRAASRVTRSDRKDSMGQRLAKVEWSLSELDRRSLRSLHTTLAEELQARGIGSLRSSVADGTGDEWPVTGAAAHHMGTTRMGANARTSVVDLNCRVHEVGNLYMAGSSVFPTGGAANPTLTIVALAVRLGRHVRSQLDRPALISRRETLPATPGGTDRAGEER